MPSHSSSFLIRRRSLFSKSKSSTENVGRDASLDQKPVHGAPSDQKHDPHIGQDGSGHGSQSISNDSATSASSSKAPLQQAISAPPGTEAASASYAPAEKLGRTATRSRTFRERFLNYGRHKAASPMPTSVEHMPASDSGIRYEPDDEGDMLTFDKFESLQKQEQASAAHEGVTVAALWSALGDCPICCEAMEQGRAIFVTECGHPFHFACLQGYDSTGELPCPICRAHLSEPPILLKNRKVEAEWFYRITRAESEALLLSDGRNGTFLVRESHTRKGTFTLSFLQEGIPRHCRIFNTLDGQFAADSYKAFDTLNDLVEWYRVHAIVGGTDGTPLLSLSYPCTVQQAPTERTVSAPTVVNRRLPPAAS